MSRAVGDRGRRHQLPLAAIVLFLGWAPTAAASVNLPEPTAAAGHLPGQPYRWVHPPDGLRDRTPPPASVTAALPLDGSRLHATEVSTADLQTTVAISDLQFVPGSSHSLSLRIAPIDPATLGPLPKGRHAAGNAYRVDLTDQGRDVGDLDALAAPGRVDGSFVVLHSSVTAMVVLHSIDGTGWSPVETLGMGPFDLQGHLPGSGYFVAASVTGGGTKAGAPLMTAVAAVVLSALGTLGALRRWGRRHRR